MGEDPKATLIVGLATPRGFLPLPVTASSGTGRDHSMLVSPNVTHNVVISTQYFKLTGASGAPIGALPIPVTISSSLPTIANVITVRITGVGHWERFASGGKSPTPAAFFDESLVVILQLSARSLFRTAARPTRAHGFTHPRFDGFGPNRCWSLAALQSANLNQ